MVQHIYIQLKEMLMVYQKTKGYGIKNTMKQVKSILKHILLKIMEHFYQQIVIDKY